jgi:tetratricopeptide (TPR) repeat protein
MLRNFPRTGTEVVADKPAVSFWGRFAKKREKELEKIQEEIVKGQDNIVPPRDINEAQKRFMELDPELARILFEADQALDSDDLRAAEDLALEALKKDKRSAQAYVVIGRVASLRGHFEDAKEAYKTAIKSNDELGEAYFGLGEIELRSEDFTQAIEHLQKAVILDRSQSAWHAALGRAFMEVRQFAKAAKALKRATVLDIDNKDYRDLAMQAEEKQRTHAQAFRTR